MAESGRVRISASTKGPRVCQMSPVQALPVPLGQPVLLAVESACINDASNLLVNILAFDGADPAIVEFVEPPHTRSHRPAGRLLGGFLAKMDEVVYQPTNDRFGCFDAVTVDELVPIVE